MSDRTDRAAAWGPLRPLARLEDVYLEEMSDAAHTAASEARRAGHFGLAKWAKGLEVEACSELCTRWAEERDRAHTDQLELFAELQDQS